MAFMGLVQFSLQCFTLLAWPLLALVYPLCCSIRAIEANSIMDAHKLNTYWVAFSFILLFEHTFMKLLQWLPLWSYIRLTIVFWLVIPHFNGAFYVYKCLICPCLSIDFRIVINWFNNRNKSSFTTEKLLAEVERYVKENGLEALEKIVASQSERTKSNPNLKELKAVSSAENEEVSSRKPSPTGTENIIFASVDNEEKAAGVTAVDRGTLRTPSPKKVEEVNMQSDTTFNSQLDGKIRKVVCEQQKIKKIEDGSFVGAIETKDKVVEVLTSTEVVESFQKVQKEWTCVACQLRILSEADMRSHLQGRRHKARHKAACEEALKTKKQTFVPKAFPPPASTANEAHQPNEEPENSTTKDSNDKMTVDASSNGIIKNIVTTHLKEDVEGQQQKPTLVPSIKDLTLSCDICNVHCPSEIVMASHLNGSKHQKKMQQREQNPN